MDGRPAQWEWSWCSGPQHTVQRPVLGSWGDGIISSSKAGGERGGSCTVGTLQTVLREPDETDKSPGFEVMKELMAGRLAILLRMLSQGAACGRWWAEGPWNCLEFMMVSRVVCACVMWILVMTGLTHTVIFVDSILVLLYGRHFREVCVGKTSCLHSVYIYYHIVDHRQGVFLYVNISDIRQVAISC